MNSNKNDRIWLACGENCMPINLLRRFDYYAPSTPFSSCRSNVFHFYQFEKTNYFNYLNLDYMIKANAFTNTPYFNVYHRSELNYKQGSHRYLELTHHNPYDKVDLAALQRRCKRMLQYRESQRYVEIIYHHRSNSGFSKEILNDLVKKMDHIRGYYSNARVLCFTQNLVKSSNERRIELLTSSSKRVVCATLHTLSSWSGSNLDLFFGRSDDDLFQSLFNWYINKTI